MRRRQAGVLLPLFALRSARGWGIGEIGDLPPLCAWLAAARHTRLQLLPIFEMAPGERSPYAAITAFAIDPIYLSLAEVEDFVAAGGEAALQASDRVRVEALRASVGIPYDTIRAVKRRALEVAFAQFLSTEWNGESARAGAFRRFCAREAGWLEEYVLFRALKEHRGERSWEEWEPALRHGRRGPLEVSRRDLASSLHFHRYVQWLADEQWERSRRAAATAGVDLDGDLPFMVSCDSADVWARQREFRLDASLGAPPDALSAEGQDWGLPVYRWDVMEAGGCEWLRQRLGRAAALFGGCRLDHVVGYYRMFVRPLDDEPVFTPQEEDEQRALGDRLLGLIQAAGRDMEIFGEDLGDVPDFVRAALATLGVPGYRILRWEADDGTVRDPCAYPALSIAAPGTHDTSSLASWWTDELDDEGRKAFAECPAFAGLASAGAAFTPAVHAALLDGLYAAGSDRLVLPFADAYGGRERINVPATTGDKNWGYQMPWPVEELDKPGAAEVGARLRALAIRHDRA